jgi:hypothetical protein
MVAKADSRRPWRLGDVARGDVGQLRLPCFRKQTHATWHEANLHRREQARADTRHAADQLRTYRCPHCAQFHIGHDPYYVRKGEEATVKAITFEEALASTAGEVEGRARRYQLAKAAREAEREAAREVQTEGINAIVKMIGDAMATVTRPAVEAQRAAVEEVEHAIAKAADSGIALQGVFRETPGLYDRWRAERTRRAGSDEVAVDVDAEIARRAGQVLVKAERGSVDAAIAAVLTVDADLYQRWRHASYR